MRRGSLLLLTLFACEQSISDDTPLKDLESDQIADLCAEFARDSAKVTCSDSMEVTTPAFDEEACKADLSDTPSSCFANVKDFRACRTAFAALDPCDLEAIRPSECDWTIELDCLVE